MPQRGIVLLALLSTLPFCGCGAKPDDAWPSKPGPKVLTSFPPLYCFALNVTGDDATVRSLLTTQGAHHHGDPPAEQMKLANQADVLFINGLGIDDNLARRIKKASGNTKFQIVELGEAIDKKSLLEGVCHHDHGDKHKGHDHGHDPHVWLSAAHARNMVNTIRDEMKKLDPAHAAGYDARAEVFLTNLAGLERDGNALLRDKKERKIISFHDSLRYFAQCYGIVIADSIQIEPGIEPSRKHLDELIQLCKKENIRVIAVEPQFPKNTSAHTVLRELKKEGIDAVFVEIDPLETADEKGLTPDLYERVMRANLENLAKALK